MTLLHDSIRLIHHQESQFAQILEGLHGFVLKDVTQTTRSGHHDVQGLASADELAALLLLRHTTDYADNLNAILLLEVPTHLLEDGGDLHGQLSSGCDDHGEGTVSVVVDVPALEQRVNDW